jgi:hypothetical protein
MVQHSKTIMLLYCKILLIVQEIILWVLIVVFPCMLIITQLLFQQNALVYYKQKLLQFVLCVFVFLASTCFSPRGPSSGGAMSVPS